MRVPGLILLLLLIMKTALGSGEDMIGSSKDCGCGAGRDRGPPSLDECSSEAKDLADPTSDSASRIASADESYSDDKYSHTSKDGDSDKINWSKDMLQKAGLGEPDMVRIQGRTFQMGTNKPGILRDGEDPRRAVKVQDFWIDRFEVSNAWYRAFVEETGYETESEAYGWSFVVDEAVPAHLREKITQGVLGAPWWLPVNGSYWREPEGPGSDVFTKVGGSDRSNYPVTQVSWTDSVRFCEWRNGARLPTEAEWELAAKGNQDGKVFPWGNKFTTDGAYRANIFQGDFPLHNTVADGYKFLAPVDAFGPQTETGLYNMIGNAWEWVEDWWTVRHAHSSIDYPMVNPRGPSNGDEKVKKGGSFLCHKSFCYRYRSAARFKATPDSGTLNGGFRCAKTVDN